MEKKWKCQSLQTCLALCDPMDGSPPGSFVHGISQAITPEWVAISFSRGSFRPRNPTWVYLHRRQILYLLSHQRRCYLFLPSRLDVGRKAVVGSKILVHWLAVWF